MLQYNLRGYLLTDKSLMFGELLVRSYLNSRACHASLTTKQYLTLITLTSQNGLSSVFFFFEGKGVGVGEGEGRSESAIRNVNTNIFLK